MQLPSTSGNTSRRRTRGRGIAATVYLLAQALGPAACAPADEGAAYDRSVRSLAATIAGAPANAALAERIDARLERARTEPAAVAAELREALAVLGLEPLRVPGLFYRTHPWTGADLSRVEVWLGRPVPLVETGEVDPVERNAARVRDAVHAAAHAGRRVVLFSASKGSADVQAALAGDPTLGSSVAAWIDLVGLLEGTPLTDPGFADAERASLGLPDDTATSMSRRTRASLASAPFPAGIRAVHLAGFPTRAAISQAARAGFERLRPLGPNDGFLLLDTFLRAPGRVVVLPETDHYLRTPALEPHVVAVVSVLLDELASDAPAAAR